MAAAWSVLALLVTILVTRRFKSGLVIGIVVLSHWLLDFIVWNDMLITFYRGIRVGFGLFNSIGFSTTNFSELSTSTLIASSIELSLLIAGVTIYLLYLRKTKKEKSQTLRVKA